MCTYDQNWVQMARNISVLEWQTDFQLSSIGQVIRSKAQVKLASLKVVTSDYSRVSSLEYPLLIKTTCISTDSFTNYKWMLLSRASILKLDTDNALIG